MHWKCTNSNTNKYNYKDSYKLYKKILWHLLQTPLFWGKENSCFFFLNSFSLLSCFWQCLGWFVKYVNLGNCCKRIWSQLNFLAGTHHMECPVSRFKTIDYKQKELCLMEVKVVCIRIQNRRIPCMGFFSQEIGIMWLRANR